MQAPDAVVSAYESALPDDDRVEKKQMFGSPCAFVNRQMFFGTFGETFVARIGPRRVQALLAHPNMTVFTLAPDKQWDDYVQIEASVDVGIVTKIAAEAMQWTLTLPPRPPLTKEEKKARKAARKAKKKLAKE